VAFFLSLIAGGIGPTGHVRADGKDLQIVPDSGPLAGKVVYTNSHALLIGVNKYPHLPADKQLQFAVNDVTALREDLIKYYGFPAANVKVLLNEQATKANIERELSRLSDNVHIQPDDRILVYFSGHGQTVSYKGGAEKGFLVPYDANVDLANMNNAAPFQETCVRMDTIWNYLETSPAKHTLVLADACYGGRLGSSKSRSITPISQRAIEVYVGKPAMQVMTAGGEGETVDEDPSWGHGAFTKKLLEELETQGKAGESRPFTAQDLFTSIRTPIVNMTDGKQNPKFENYQGTEGEFLFITTKPQTVPPLSSTGNDTRPDTDRNKKPDTDTNKKPDSDNDTADKRHENPLDKKPEKPVYTSEQGYTIGVPKGWTSRKGKGMYDVFINADPEDDFAANLNVVVTPQSPGETLETLPTYLASELSQQFASYKNLSEGYTTVAGERAYTHTATCQFGAPLRTFRLTQAIVLKDGKEYVFTCTSLDSNHAHYESTFQEMLHSIKWTGKPNKQAGGAVFTSDKGYKITLAKDWSSRKGEGIYDVFISAAKKDDFIANLNVVVTPSTPGEMLDSYPEALDTLLSSQVANYESVSHEFITVDGERAYAHTATYQFGFPARTIRLKQVIVLRDGKDYTFTCTGLDSNHEEYDPAFQGMLDSIKWTEK
jgi:hypothetical protein